MRTLGLITIVAFGLLALGIYSEQGRDPYEEGDHLDYSIEVENGFVYKIQGSMISKTAIQVFNSDGTPLREGKKIY